MKYSPDSISDSDHAEATARKFGGLFQEVLNATVTRDHVRSLPARRDRPWQEWQWLIGGMDRRGGPVAMRLHGGGWLIANQRLGIRESERSPGLWLTTLQYRYQWQTEEDDGSWLVRWDYVREPTGRDCPYPHININGPGDFQRFHVPTRRVPIEDVIRFLILDKAASELSPRWEEVLDEATAIFDRIMARRPTED